MERNHLERLLKANGLTADAPDDEIKNMLIGASYNEAEIEKALQTLRVEQKQEENGIRQQGTKKLFQSNERLNPSEISQLLGVNVVVKEVIMAERPKPTLTMLQYVLLWVTSLIVAIVAIMSYMYTQRMGMFHPAMAQVSEQE